VLLEAIGVGEGAVEGRGGHDAVRRVGVHGGLRGRARGERLSDRRARDLHCAYIDEVVGMRSVRADHGRGARGESLRQAERAQALDERVVAVTDSDWAS
jgi:hypothetical protein